MPVEANDGLRTFREGRARLQEHSAVSQDDPVAAAPAELAPEGGLEERQVGPVRQDQQVLPVARKPVRQP